MHIYGFPDFELGIKFEKLKNPEWRSEIANLRFEISYADKTSEYLFSILFFQPPVSRNSYERKNISVKELVRGNILEKLIFKYRIVLSFFHILFITPEIFQPSSQGCDCSIQVIPSSIICGRQKKLKEKIIAVSATK